MLDSSSGIPQADAESTTTPRRGTATLRDVARAAGVSIATASRALNGSLRTVRAEYASRVLEAAASLHYEPHLSAQAIARGSTTTAALVVRDIGDPYFSAIAAGVSEVAEQAGLIVTMAVADRSPERELQIVRSLRGQRPRVIIVAGSRIDGATASKALVDELVAYQTAGGSVVMISQPELPFSTVTVDNFGGARQLARALLEQGYRRFAVIRAHHSLRTSRERYDGFVAGLRAAGVSIDNRCVIETEFTRAGGYAAASKLTGRGAKRTELVFAVNDVMAIGAMSAFRDVGLVPGEDIAVAGFDGISVAMDVAPALTSVAVPLRRVGRTAMRMALQEPRTHHVARLSTRVVLRESTPLRSARSGASRNV